MDPVSQLLAERERSAPRLLPWVAAAVILHAAAAGAIAIATSVRPSQRIHLPAVSVRLVQPPPVRRPPRRQAPAATAAPVVTPAPARPTPKPEPRPTSPPKRAEQTAPASRDAMPDARATAVAAPPPEPTEAAAGQGAGNGRGLLLAGEGGDEPPALPSDFRFTYYVERMLALIESNWYKPPVPAGTRARVRFTIAAGGRLEGIALEASSGVPSFDRSALRALYAANPLPPLPPAYGRPSVTVHLTFTESP